MADLRRIPYATRLTPLSDKLTALVEPHHVRRYSGISFEIRRSIGDSVVTSKNTKEQ